MALTRERERRERRDAPAVVDCLTLELGDAWCGRYRLALRGTDIATGRPSA